MCIRDSIGRDVDVAGTEELPQFLIVDEAVLEDEVVSHPQTLGQLLEGQPVGLALVSQYVRMGHPEHDVDRLGIALHDLRKRPHHVLYAFVGREQSEGQDDASTLYPVSYTHLRA